jgi:hypothetical protein
MPGLHPHPFPRNHTGLVSLVAAVCADRLLTHFSLTLVRLQNHVASKKIRCEFFVKQKNTIFFRWMRGSPEMLEPRNTRNTRKKEKRFGLFPYINVSLG